MFLQVGVIPKNQPSLHLLRREDPANKIAVYQDVHDIFGAKDSTTCANFSLTRDATDNEITLPEAAFGMRSDFYMRAQLESSLTIGKAEQKFQDLVKMVTEGWFTLKKVVNNVRRVLSTLSQTDNPTNGNVKTIAVNDESSHVLGLKKTWVLRLSRQPRN